MAEEPQPWTGSELASRLYDATGTLNNQGRVLIDYCDGIDPVMDGPYIPSPQVLQDFVNQVKRVLVATLREIADSLEGRPLPPRVPPNQQPPPVLQSSGDGSGS